MHIYSIAEAKALFSELIAQAETGEEVIITRRGQAVSRIQPINPLRIILPEVIPMHRVVLSGEPPYPGLCQALVQEQIAELHVPEAPARPLGGEQHGEALSFLMEIPAIGSITMPRSTAMAFYHMPARS